VVRGRLASDDGSTGGRSGYSGLAGRRERCAPFLARRLRPRLAGASPLRFTREASVATSDLNLVSLTGLFVNFLNTHHGEFPKDEATFKAYIAEKGATVLSKAGVADASYLFLSTPDGEPVEIIYENPLDPRAARSGALRTPRHRGQTICRISRWLGARNHRPAILGPHAGS
jgi:hypothetical protein